VAPLGVYGNSKAQGEAEVRNILAKHIILRTSWLYGIHGQNFVKTMLRLGREKETLNIVDDQFGCPTFAADFAEAILSIAARIIKEDEVSWGTYHYCDQGKISWYDFAKAIFKLAGHKDSFVVQRVEPISSAQYPTRAKRPSNSVLSCNMLALKFGIYQKPWQEGLSKMIQLLSSSSVK
jgi:dTDP-4-dehydrorhamnose reductase